MAKKITNDIETLKIKIFTADNNADLLKYSKELIISLVTQQESKTTTPGKRRGPKPGFKRKLKAKPGPKPKGISKSKKAKRPGRKPKLQEPTPEA